MIISSSLDGKTNYELQREDTLESIAAVIPITVDALILAVQEIVDVSRSGLTDPPTELAKFMPAFDGFEREVN